MLRKFNLKTMALALAVSVLLTGCGKSEVKKDSGNVNETVKVKLKISLMFPLYSNYPPMKNDVWKLIDEKINIELDLTAVPSANYTDKISVMMAANELPDSFVWDNYDAKFISYVKQGAFLQLDNIIGNYKNLQKSPKVIYDNIRVDSKLFGIPRPRPIGRSMPYIRKDWLDNLGLSIPKTLDEFADVALKFTNNDPDKNGKNDTFGIGLGVTNGAISLVSTLFAAFDAGNGWRVNEDSTVTNQDITPGTKEALNWLRNLYSKGGIDKDFGITNTTQAVDKFKAGKSGIILDDNINSLWKNLEVMIKQEPKANQEFINPPTGPKGKSGVYADAGYLGFWVMSSKLQKQKVERVMELMEWFASDEGYSYKKNGIEGIHHTKQSDGTIVRNNEKFQQDGIDGTLPHEPYDKYRLINQASTPIEHYNKMKLMFDKVESMVVTNPILNFNSQVLADKGQELKKLRDETYIKIVMGVLPLEAYDKYVEEYLKMGGKQIADEANAYYKLNKSSSSK